LRLPRHWRRDRDDFDELTYETMTSGMERLLSRGMTADDAARVVVEGLNEALDIHTPRVVARVTGTAPRMLRRDRRTARKFQRLMRKYWRPALDRFMAIVVAAEESGREYNLRHRGEAIADDGYLFEAMTGLHARACRTALEAHHLLSGGFPKGALGRGRTLHELAVVSSVIAEYGTQGEHADLAERFLLHDVISSWEDATTYQQHCDVLGQEPLSDAEMDRMKVARDQLVARFGKGYGHRDYGWAARLFPGEIPTFKKLELRAELAHMRSYYGWASHEIHVDAKGWRSTSRNCAGCRITRRDPPCGALLSQVIPRCCLCFRPPSAS
jgi:Family of unknown function (DUF5677)